MPTFDTDGIDFRYLLRFGVLEFAWLQNEQEEQQRRRIRSNMAEPGFVGRWHGNAHAVDFGWTIRDRDDNGIMRLRVAESDAYLDRRDQWGYPAELAVVDADGRVTRIPRNDGRSVGVTVPDDAQWYTIVARRVRTKLEEGRAAVTTASTTVIGTYTEFTRLIGKNDPDNLTDRGMLLRIDAGATANGNDGVYEIDTVVSDTELTLMVPPNGTTESSLAFSIAGSFLGTPPADLDIHNRNTLEFELVAPVRGVKPPNSDLIVCDVKRDTGTDPTTMVVERRHSNIYRTIANPNAQKHGYVPSVVLNTDDPTALTVRSSPIYIPWALITGDIECTDGALTSNLRNVLWVVGCASGDIAVATQAANQHEGKILVTDVHSVDTSGTAFSPSIVQIPSGLGVTHMVVYDKNGTIAMRTSADNGTTWSGETTIWNAPLVDALDTVRGPCIILTRDFRLIVAAAYSDDSLGRTEIRWIYTDDIGSALTWNTNGDAGHLFVTDSVGLLDLRRPHLAQDDDGNIWCAYERRDTEGQIRLIRGDTPNSLNPNPQDNDGTSLGRVVSLALSELTSSLPVSGWIRGPRLWVGPDGAMCVFYGAWHADVSRFHIMSSEVHFVESRAQIVGHHSIMRNIRVGWALGRPALGYIQDASGALHACWSTTDGSPDNLQHWMINMTPTHQAIHAVAELGQEP